MIFAFLIGILAGLRALTPLAAVSWAARLGWLNLNGTWLAFLGATVTPYIASLLALAELVGDKLPTTPSRKTSMPFGARILSGALCGAAVAGGSALGLCLGAIGAVAGTLGGAALRARLAQAFGKDIPAALLEDVVTIGGTLLILSRFA